MQIIKAPNPIPSFLFLAGSIEMGTAENWQERTQKLLEETHWIILNPRRDDWDSSWKQDISNPQFKEQVKWELTAMERADCILMHFDPSTKSPITLLELGLHANGEKLVVSCPDGFWRKGNVQIVCKEYKIPLFNSLEEALENI